MLEGLQGVIDFLTALFAAIKILVMATIADDLRKTIMRKGRGIVYRGSSQKSGEDRPR